MHPEEFVAFLLFIFGSFILAITVLNTEVSIADLEGSGLEADGWLVLAHHRLCLEHLRHRVEMTQEVEALHKLRYPGCVKNLLNIVYFKVFLLVLVCWKGNKLFHYRSGSHHHH